MTSVHYFKDLTAWRVAHSLAVDVYQITTAFPRHEQFGLISQMRRAAVSITSNIAEGSGRWTAEDKKRFYIIAIGSAHELESQLLIAKDVGYLEEMTLKDLVEEIHRSCRLLQGLIRAVLARPHPPSPIAKHQTPKKRP